MFEDIAADLIKKDPSIKQKLEEAKKNDPKLAQSAEAQLFWVYRNSPYFEKTFLRYPVGRILTYTKLDLK